MLKLPRDVFQVLEILFDARQSMRQMSSIPNAARTMPFLGELVNLLPYFSQGLKCLISNKAR